MWARAAAFAHMCLAMAAGGPELEGFASEAWCVYSEPRNAKNIAERLQCKVVHGIATGRSYFNRKLMEIGENRQKGNSVHSENAQAAAKRKIIPVVHVTCVSLPVCSAEAPARPMPWPRRTQKTSSWRTRACVPGPRLGHTPLPVGQSACRPRRGARRTAPLQVFRLFTKPTKKINAPCATWMGLLRSLSTCGWLAG